MKPCIVKDKATSLNGFTLGFWQSCRDFVESE